MRADKQKEIHVELSKSFWFALLLTLLMVVLTACGGSTAPSGPQQVQVTLSEFLTITSSVTAFSPGTSYHFVVTNNERSLTNS